MFILRPSIMHIHISFPRTTDHESEHGMDRLNHMYFKRRKEVKTWCCLNEAQCNTMVKEIPNFTCLIRDEKAKII